VQRVAGLLVAAVQAHDAGHEGPGVHQLVQYMLQEQVVPAGLGQCRRHLPEGVEALVGRQHGTVGGHHQHAFVRGFQRHAQPRFGTLDTTRQPLLLLPGDLAQQRAHQPQAARRHDARRHQTGQHVVERDLAHQDQAHQRHDAQRGRHGHQREQQPQAPALQPLQLGNKPGFVCVVGHSLIQSRQRPGAKRRTTRRTC
jgi:hypothetical protein